MKYKIGSIIVNKNTNKRYKVIDRFKYKNSLKTGYVIKDTWSPFEEPKIVTEELVLRDYFDI